jgi:hypothetical protein
MFLKNIIVEIVRVGRFLAWRGQMIAVCRRELTQVVIGIIVFSRAADLAACGRRTGASRSSAIRLRTSAAGLVKWGGN